MGRLLFESKGVPGKTKVLYVIFSLLLVIGGVLLLIFPNFRGNISIDNIGLYIGNVGGAHSFSNGQKIIMMLVGILMIVLGILLIFNIRATNQSYVNIYENRIQGLRCVAFLFFHRKQKFDIDFYQIKNIQVLRNSFLGDSIAVRFQDERVELLFQRNVDEAACIINHRIKEL